MRRAYHLAALATFAVLGSSRCSEEGAAAPEACVADGAVAVPNEGWVHVDDPTELVYDHNPPASGPHFAAWAGYDIHTEVVDRGNWVHNLEHGAVVLLIGPTATEEQRQTVLDAYQEIPADVQCGHRRVVVTTDPLLDEPMAAVAADVVLEGVLSVEQIVNFAVSCRDRAPEDVCF